MIEKKPYLHIGPKFGTMSKQAVTEAIKACRDKREVRRGQQSWKNRSCTARLHLA
jgi:hypothetical protein